MNDFVPTPSSDDSSEDEEPDSGSCPDIPDFDVNGNLPPGVHRVSLSQVKRRFAWNSHRAALFDGLERALKNLAAAGVRRVWIDGGFITAKPNPKDIDGCWEYDSGVNVDKLDPVFLKPDPPREAMKNKYGIDFLIAGTALWDGGGQTVEEFFQEDREGNRKGILIVEIGHEYDPEPPTV